MVVRIRVGSWAHTNTLKTALARVLRIGAWVCFAMGFWIVAAGLQWAESFPVQTGAVSHWQVWIAFGIALQLAAFRLKRPNRQLIS